MMWSHCVVSKAAWRLEDSELPCSADSQPHWSGIEALVPLNPYDV